MASESNCVTCNEPDNNDMVQCDTCDDWQHYECAGVSSDIENVEFECNKCKAEKLKANREKLKNTRDEKRLKKAAEEQRILREKLDLEKSNNSEYSEKMLSDKDCETNLSKNELN